jgi:hypothetical protein
MSRLEVLYLSFWAAWAPEILGRIRGRFDQPTSEELEGFFLQRPQVAPGTARSLRRALEHFWQGQYEAATAVAVPRIEILARQLILLFDAPVYRLQRAQAPGQYPGLGAFLAVLREYGLPESWYRYLRTAFTHVAGRNYRNEFSHWFVEEFLIVTQRWHCMQLSIWH